jgi:hypothetical protein
MLKRVEEPVEIKEAIKNLSKLLSTKGGKDVSKGALVFNKLPQYLWSSWGNDLKSLGITWQEFLKIISKNSNLIIKWAVNDEISWDELIKRFEELIMSRGGIESKKGFVTLDKFMTG